MPVSIGEIDSTVEVSTPAQGEQAQSQGSTAPSPEAQQRWVDIARRSAELAARTAAWRFDD
jgi:hypothetical protein